MQVKLSLGYFKPNVLNYLHIDLGLLCTYYPYQSAMKILCVNCNVPNKNLY